METLRGRMEADLKIGCYNPSARKFYQLEAGIEKYAEPAATLGACMQTLDQRKRRETCCARILCRRVMHSGS